MVERGNEGRVLQRQSTLISELLLMYVCICYTFLYFERGKTLSEEQLFEGLSRNAEILFSGDAMIEAAVAKAGVTRAASMKPGSTVLERVYAVQSALEYLLEGNPKVTRLYRDDDHHWISRVGARVGACR